MYASAALRCCVTTPRSLTASREEQVLMLLLEAWPRPRLWMGTPMVGLLAITLADGTAGFLAPPNSAMVEATSFTEELAVTDTCKFEQNCLFMLERLSIVRRLTPSGDLQLSSVTT